MSKKKFNFRWLIIDFNLVFRCMLWANLSFYISFLAKNIKRYEVCYSIHMGNGIRSKMIFGGALSFILSNSKVLNYMIHHLSKISYPALNHFLV